MVEKDNPAESRREQRELVLDLTGLGLVERSSVSDSLGHNDRQFVTPEDSFEYNQVHAVIFKWADEQAEQMLNVLLEHDNKPEAERPSFGAFTIIGDKVWKLTIQEEDFNPREAYAENKNYMVVPFNRYALAAIKGYLSITSTKPHLLGKVGPRWVAFGDDKHVR